MADVTIYTLAKELNMTPSMVSRAFNPACKVSKQKRKLVLETAEKYGFSPNKMASRLSMKKIKIGILINSRFEVNTEKMLKGIESAYQRLKDYKVDYDIIVVNPRERPNFDYGSIFEKYKDFDGVIVSGLSSSKYSEALKKLYQANEKLVQVQSVNTDTDYLFASKHNEETASKMACEFIYNCLKKSQRKNVILFIGDKESTLHMSAAKAFEHSCKEMGLRLLETVEFSDNPDLLAKKAPEVFGKYDGEIDGIYITSGISGELCRYLEKSGQDVVFVAFDTHDEVRTYLEKGVVSATIDQNVTRQMKNAFENLAMNILNGTKCDKIIFTDVQLVLNSNIYQFD